MSSDLQGQGTPVKVRKSSPNAIKQGPMKATIPIACVLKRSNNFKNVSPTPPYWKSKISPDYPFDQKYSSSIIYKAKSRTLSGSSIKALEVMRKTSSLDSVYKWSHDEFFYPKIFQTGNDLQTSQVGDQSNQRLHKNVGEDYLIFRRNYSQYERQDSVSRSLPSNIIADDLTLRIRAQSSLEGLNREVASLTYRNERLIGSNLTSRFGFIGSTPDGHKAPIRDLASPQKSLSSSASSTSNIPADSPPRYSNSPIIPIQDSSSEPDNPTDSQSDDGTPLGTSPLPRQFTSDLTQTGGERIIIKARSRQTCKSASCETHLQPSFKLKPSSTSAFDILKPVARRVDENQRVQEDYASVNEPSVEVDEKVQTTSQNKMDAEFDE